MPGGWDVVRAVRELKQMVSKSPSLDIAHHVLNAGAACVGARRLAEAPHVDRRCAVSEWILRRAEYRIIDRRQILLNAGRPPDTFNYKSIDLRIEKIIRLAARQQASVAFEGFNVFNSTNFGCYNGDIPLLPNTNPNFGKPACTVETSTRRLQLGVRYSF